MCGFDERFDERSDEGFDEGSDEGFDEGSDEGFDEGSDEGFDEGSDEGSDRGLMKWRIIYYKTSDLWMYKQTGIVLYCGVLSWMILY
jgi:hypothetical protein